MKAWEKEVLYIKEINGEIQKQFKNGDKPARFIILAYDNGDNENWDDLKDENIQIVQLKDLADFDIRLTPYVSRDGYHPSGLVWDMVTPKLIEKIENYDK